jgi:tRNA A37 threonylcarbamoyladenosine modification protein TsaB
LEEVYVWKKCKCGVLTDADENQCPCGLFSKNGEHKLEEVSLTTDLFAEFRRNHKVFTKHHAHPQVLKTNHNKKESVP